MALTSKDIFLGSGELYAVAYTEGSALPDIDDVVVETNRLSHIKNGATVTYEPTSNEIKDDMGLVSKVIISEEKATFKTGLMTWNPEVLAKFNGTGAYETQAATSSAEGYNRFKLGGLKRFTNKPMFFVFRHADGIHQLYGIGENAAGFEFAFNPEDPTIIDLELTLKPMDSDGRLFYFEEILPKTT